jgi:hypothetical protein
MTFTLVFPEHGSIDHDRIGGSPNWDGHAGPTRRRRV